MRKMYTRVFYSYFFACIFLLISFKSQAQPQFYNFNTGGSSNSNPFNTNISRATEWLVAPGEMPGAINGQIVKVYFRFATAQTPTYTNFTIKLAQTTGTTLSATAWAANKILVYSSASETFTTVANDWYGFTLQTPFTYDPTQSLIVEIAHTNLTGTGPGVLQTSGFTTRRTYGTATSATPSGCDGLLAHIGIDVTPASPCTSPPTAGTSTISTATSVCPGTSLQLNLSGNSIGSGQTYVWQKSATLAGTYTDISTSALTPFYAINPTVSAYYRCAVTCGTSTTYSTPVQALVSLPFPAGTYTINSAVATGSGNFQTFGAAISAISCGVAGAVTFNVVAGSGPYNEQIIIPQIIGAAANARITINGNGATLQATPTTDARHIIKLNGGSFVSIKNLGIKSLDATYGWGVHLLGGANNDSIIGCNINMNAVTSTTQSNSAGIVASNSTTSVLTAGSNVNNLVVSGCTILGAYQGIILNGTATTLDVNNKLIDNNVQDFYANGIVIVNTNNCVISGNDISRRSRLAVTTFEGIEIGAGNINALVNANTIHDTHTAATTQTGTSYGIYFNSCDAAVGSENKVTNNLLTNFNSGSGTIYGIYNSGSDGAFYYHNTIVLSYNAATAGVTRGFYQTTDASNIKFMNNIVYISRTGTGIKYCVYFGTTTSTIVSNNNVLFNSSSAGTNGIGTLGTTGYATLANWQAVSSNAYDQASVSVDPIFTSVGDYTPTSFAVNNIGAAVGVATDFLGLTRSAVSPDPGAYEFSTLTAGLNFGAESLLSPIASTTGCYTNNEVVSVRIRNNRTSTHDFVANPVTVTVNITGAITQTLNTTINTGTLASDGTLDVVLPAINMTTAGAYNFAASTSLTGDVNTANDAMLPVTRTKVALNAGTIVVSPVTYCGNNGTAPTLTATGNTGYSFQQWQISNTTGVGFSNIVGANSSVYSFTGAITQDKYFKLKTFCGSDSLSSNEGIVTLINPTVTTTTPGTNCGTGTVSLSAAPSTGATINWYDVSTGGSPLVVGNNNFTTPSISATTTYYAAAVTGGGSENVATPAVGTSTFYTASAGWGLRFTVNSTVTINSVKMTASNASAGPATMQIKVTDLTDAVLYTGTLYNFNITTALAEYTIPVNITLPPGANYKMVMTATGVNTLVRESSGVTFPYSSPSNSVNITAGANGTGTAQTTSAYYWFYSWVVSAGCVSARTPVVATINNTPGCGSVPITLLNFKGEKQGAINKLSWTTATEINNKGFELERSADGINFSKIAYLDSKALNGNSNSNIAYEYNDLKPLESNCYYRLKQIDRDGKSTNSSVVLVKGSKIVQLHISSIFPNPIETTVNMIFVSPSASKIKVVLSDASGKIVAQKDIFSIVGENNCQIFVPNLAKGVYFVKIISDGGNESAIYKLMK